MTCFIWYNNFTQERQMALFFLFFISMMNYVSEWQESMQA